MKHEIATNAISSPKVAAAVASATAGSGLAEWLGILNGLLGVIALMIGILLSSILIIKHLKEIKIMEAREHRRRKEDKCELDQD